MNDNTYKIVISGVGDDEQSIAQGKTGKTTPAGTTAKSLIKAGVVVAAVKTAVDYATSSIEMYTGNSVAQRKTDEMLGLPGALLGFIANPASMFVNVAKASNANMWETRRAEQMARRSGNYLSTTTR